MSNEDMYSLAEDASVDTSGSQIQPTENQAVGRISEEGSREHQTPARNSKKIAPDAKSVDSGYSEAGCTIPQSSSYNTPTMNQIRGYESQPSVQIGPFRDTSQITPVSGSTFSSSSSSCAPTAQQESSLSLASIVESIPNVPDEEVEEYIWMMPAELKEEYQDAMILYSNEDRQHVEDFLSGLLQNIKLRDSKCPKVVMYNDFCIARSEIKALEFGLERSTYVFIYLTENFVKDTWAEFSGETCLTEAIYNVEKRWCVVPVFTYPKRNCPFKVPSCINSLKGIQYWSGVNDKFYNDSVKKLLDERLHVRKRNEAILRKKRRNWVKKYKADEYLKQMEEEQEERRQNKILNARILHVKSIHSMEHQQQQVPLDLNSFKNRSGCYFPVTESQHTFTGSQESEFSSVQETQHYSNYDLDSNVVVDAPDSKQQQSSKQEHMMQGLGSMTRQQITRNTLHQNHTSDSIDRSRMTTVIGPQNMAANMVNQRQGNQDHQAMIDPQNHLEMLPSHGHNRSMQTVAGSAGTTSNVAEMRSQQTSMRIMGTVVGPPTVSGAYNMPTTVAGHQNMPPTVSGPYNMPTTVGGHQNIPPSVGGPYNMPTTVGGHQNMPPKVGGSHNMPPTVAGHQNMPTTVGGYQNMPTTVGGHQNMPPTVSGHQNMPPTVGGHHNMPTTVGGHQNMPTTVGGHHNMPTTVGGHHNMPTTVGGHQNMPTTVGGLQNMPSIVGGNQNMPINGTGMVLDKSFVKGWGGIAQPPDHGHVESVKAKINPQETMMDQRYVRDTKTTVGRETMSQDMMGFKYDVSNVLRGGLSSELLNADLAAKVNPETMQVVIHNHYYPPVPDQLRPLNIINPGVVQIGDTNVVSGSTDGIAPSEELEKYDINATQDEHSLIEKSNRSVQQQPYRNDQLPVSNPCSRLSQDNLPSDNPGGLSHRYNPGLHMTQPKCYEESSSSDSSSGDQRQKQQVVSSSDDTRMKDAPLALGDPLASQFRQLNNSSLNPRPVGITHPMQQKVKENEEPRTMFNTAAKKSDADVSNLATQMDRLQMNQMERKCDSSEPIPSIGHAIRDVVSEQTVAKTVDDQSHMREDDDDDDDPFDQTLLKQHHVSPVSLTFNCNRSSDTENALTALSSTADFTTAAAMSHSDPSLVVPYGFHMSDKLEESQNSSPCGHSKTFNSIVRDVHFDTSGVVATDDGTLLESRQIAETLHRGEECCGSSVDPDLGSQTTEKSNDIDELCSDRFGASGALNVEDFSSDRVTCKTDSKPVDHKCNTM